MRPRFIFWTLRRAQYAAVSLIVVLAVSSCAPAASAPVVPTVSEAAIPTTAAPAEPSAPEATAVVPVQAVATSRGPNLEATDPSSVSLASGQLQLVEFFRFT